MNQNNSLDLNRVHFDHLYSEASPYRPMELWNRRQRARYVSHVVRSSDLWVLEIGCGDGFVTRHIASECKSVEGIVGIDLSSVGIDRAVRKSLSSKVEFRCTSLEDFSTDRRFDVICMFDMLEHLDEPEKALIKIRSLLAAGGRLLLSTPNRLRIGNRIRQARGHAPAVMDPTHIHEFSLNEIQELLSRNGFRVSSEWGIVTFVADWLLALSNRSDRKKSQINATSIAPSSSPEQNVTSSLKQRLRKVILRTIQYIEESRLNYWSGYFFPNWANGIYVLSEVEDTRS